MNTKIEAIHESFINGQKKQAVEQMNAYGMTEFFSDYTDYLGSVYGPEKAFAHLKDACVSYHRINVPSLKKNIKVSR